MVVKTPNWNEVFLCLFLCFGCGAIQSSSTAAENSREPFVNLKLLLCILASKAY